MELESICLVSREKMSRRRGRIDETSITLVASSDWTRNGLVLDLARRTNRALNDEDGVWFACNERYGGNTLDLDFPYVHVTSTPFRIRERFEDAELFQRRLRGRGLDARLDQAAFVALASESGLVDLESAQNFIFVGLRINERDSEANLESTWRTWSKVDVLTRSLNKNNVDVLNVSFRRQIKPKNLRLFSYCILVIVNIDSMHTKMKCLNVLQKLRGSTIPGYVSLFERSKTNKEYEDSLDEILSDLDEAEFDRRRRKKKHFKRRRRRTRSNHSF